MIFFFFKLNLLINVICAKLFTKENNYESFKQIKIKIIFNSYVQLSLSLSYIGNYLR